MNSIDITVGEQSANTLARPQNTKCEYHKNLDTTQILRHRRPFVGYVVCKGPQMKINYRSENCSPTYNPYEVVFKTYASFPSVKNKSTDLQRIPTPRGGKGESISRQ